MWVGCGRIWDLSATRRQEDGESLTAEQKRKELPTPQKHLDIACDSYLYSRSQQKCVFIVQRTLVRGWTP